jgi:hypothetical protein
MSPPGRPKGESPSAQREGSPSNPADQPERESPSAQREGSLNPADQPYGESPSAQREGSPTGLRSVCVFCGSSPGLRPRYREAARELGIVLARRGITLVYGGGHVGLMGAVADAVLSQGGQVVGVIPEHLMRPEVAHQNLTELRVVDSMHTRKRLMAERADAFVVLPGGYGTFEEMFEMITWLQLRLQSKPVGMFNVEGYYDALLGFLRHAADEGFIRAEHRDLLIVESMPALLLERLALHVPAAVVARRGLSDLDRA